MSLHDGMHWGVYVADYLNRADFVLIDSKPDGRRAVAKPTYFELVPLPDNEAIEAPTFSLPFEKAKQLMQAMWDAGIRPASGEGSGAQVSALQKHIQFAESVASRAFDLLDKGAA